MKHLLPKLLFAIILLGACKKQDPEPVFTNTSIPSKYSKELSNPNTVEITDSITGAHSIVHIEYTPDKLVSRIYNQIITPAVGEDSTTEQIFTYENGKYKSIKTRVSYISAPQKNKILYENFTYKNNRPYKYQNIFQTGNGSDTLNYSYYIFVDLNGNESISKIMLNDSVGFLSNVRLDFYYYYGYGIEFCTNINDFNTQLWIFYYQYNDNLNINPPSTNMQISENYQERNKSIKSTQLSVLRYLNLQFKVPNREQNIISYYEAPQISFFYNIVQYQHRYYDPEFHEIDTYKTFNYQLDALSRPLIIKSYLFDKNSVLLESKKYQFSY